MKAFIFVLSIALAALSSSARPAMEAEESDLVLKSQHFIQIALFQELLKDYNISKHFARQFEKHVNETPLEKDIQKPIQGNKVFSCLGLILNKLMCPAGNKCFRAFETINSAKEILLSLGKLNQCEESSIQDQWLETRKEKEADFIVNWIKILLKVDQTLAKMTKSR